jgi:hypothetical protein
MLTSFKQSLTVCFLHGVELKLDADDSVDENRRKSLIELENFVLRVVELNFEDVGVGEVCESVVDGDDREYEMLRQIKASLPARRNGSAFRSTKHLLVEKIEERKDK